MVGRWAYACSRRSASRTVAYRCHRWLYLGSATGDYPVRWPKLQVWSLISQRVSGDPPDIWQARFSRCIGGGGRSSILDRFLRSKQSTRLTPLETPLLEGTWVGADAYVLNW